MYRKFSEQALRAYAAVLYRLFMEAVEVGKDVHACVGLNVFFGGFQAFGISVLSLNLKPMIED